MPRFYTRLQQRRYKEKRREQAALVAARLLGKKKVSFHHDDRIQQSLFFAKWYQYNMNIMASSPRSNAIIKGLTI